MTSSNENKSSNPCLVTGEASCKCKYVIEPVLPVTVKDTLRKLFSDHGVFTNIYIVAELGNLPNLNQVTQRLLQNQDDIGAAVSATYNPELGKQLATALREHILTASAVVKAAGNLQETKSKSANIVNAVKKVGIKTVNETEEAQINLHVQVQKFYKNSEVVSKIISDLSPTNLPYEVVLHHFNEHLEYVITLTNLYLNGKYDEAITEYDCYINHLLYFADMLVLV